ncbi:MAG: iron-containing alcohol dehydrogenase [Clostridia bacterium]|nr:iron-containing alcohol dehydrogenase [Clostridia bacterium]
MLGNFTYCNPTKLYFGKDALEGLKKELKNYGKNVLFVYGGGSIKKNGIYDKVISILAECGKKVYEDAGVMPNPTYEKLLEGVARARKAKAHLILAVGGGSVCDYAKAVSVSVNIKDDPWDKYYNRFEDATCKVVPVGCVLTMVGTGSEMNGGAVITNREKMLKIGHVFGENVFPKFSVLNPEFTYTLPKYQMVAGVYDIMCHILEQYLSGEDDNTSDYIAEGLMRSLINSANIAVKNPTDYEARSNIMWTATWALNTLIAKGKSTDWEVHMLGQAVGAYTDATHGMTLSAVSMAYYNHILKYGLHRFKRFAENVWGVNPAGKSDEEVAKAGLKKMEEWMKSIGLVMNLTDLGVAPEMIEGIADATLVMEGGYKVLTREEIVDILKKSL